MTVKEWEELTPYQKEMLDLFKRLIRALEDLKND